jgi:hypothetical protein
MAVGLAATDSLWLGGLLRPVMLAMSLSLLAVPLMVLSPETGLLKRRKASMTVALWPW